MCRSLVNKNYIFLTYFVVIIVFKLFLLLFGNNDREQLLFLVAVLLHCLHGEGVSGVGSNSPVKIRAKLCVGEYEICVNQVTVLSNN